MVMFNPPEPLLVGRVTPAIEKISNGCDSLALASFNSFSYRYKKERQFGEASKRRMWQLGLGQPIVLQLTSIGGIRINPWRELSVSGSKYGS
jgi:hypothetical protein